MKSEILVHEYSNNYKLNAPFFYYGKMSNSIENDCNYIIMEYLEDYLHLYNILEDELYFEAVRALGELHLTSMQQIKSKSLKNQDQIPVYDVEWYINNINKIVFDLGRFAIQNPSSDLLTKQLISKFQLKIPKIKKYLFEIKDIPLSIVHGDFDSGNIIFRKKIRSGTVEAIDWGHGHIGPPIIDIAHLVNSLGYIDYDTKIRLISEYLKACRPIYNQNVPFTYLIIGGTILHYLYHLNFKLKAVNEGYVEPNFFLEQFHNRIKQLIEILI